MLFTRSHTRHPVALTVSCRTSDGWRPGVTWDVSLDGLFIRTPPSEAINQVVQLRIELPGGQRIEPMARVRQVALRVVDHPGAPGIGVELFALSGAARQTWEAFVRTLRDRPPVDACTEVPPPRAPQPAPPPAKPVRTVPLPPADDPPQRPLFLTFVPPSLERLEDLVRRILQAGELQLQWRGACTAGQGIRLAIVHPVTDAEVAVEAHIERVVPGAPATLTARFSRISPAERARLTEFAAGFGASRPGR